MTIHWIPLQSEAEVEQLKERSRKIPCLLFKHSSKCNISSIAKYRLESDWSFDTDEVEVYFLDLLKHRTTSAYIAETFAIWHESPQVLLIINGECEYDASHLSIRVEEIKEALDSVANKY